MAVCVSKLYQILEYYSTYNLLKKTYESDLSYWALSFGWLSNKGSSLQCTRFTQTDHFHHDGMPEAFCSLDFLQASLSFWSEIVRKMQKLRTFRTISDQKEREACSKSFCSHENGTHFAGTILRTAILKAGLQLAQYNLKPFCCEIVKYSNVTKNGKLSTFWKQGYLILYAKITFPQCLTLDSLLGITEGIFDTQIVWCIRIVPVLCERNFIVNLKSNFGFLKLHSKI